MFLIMSMQALGVQSMMAIEMVGWCWQAGPILYSHKIKFNYWANVSRTTKCTVVAGLPKDGYFM